MINKIYELLQKVREIKPLIHNITNYVTVYDVANVIKTFGGSPVMADAIEECKDMTKISNALCINIGTLNNKIVLSMKESIKIANEDNIPVVFDVCGLGATNYRNEVCFDILDNYKIDIIKGNASEIAKIAGENVIIKGVDSIEINLNLQKIAKIVVKKYNLAVVITGKEDIIMDRAKGFIVKNGCKEMSEIVGTGCMSSGIVATFRAIENDSVLASTVALCLFEIAAELASFESKEFGIGTQKVKLFDNIYKLNFENIKKMKKIEVL